MGKRLLAVAVVLAAGAGVAVAVALARRDGRLVLVRASAMTALPNGGLRYSQGGKVGDLDRRGTIAHVEGTIRGLAVGKDGATYAAWIEPRGALVVGRVAPGANHIVWRGPQTGGGAAGGRIAIAPDGMLLVAVGDLGEPEKTSNADVPHGKILQLDPSGGETQKPQPISSGWTDPSAFAVTPADHLWVADDASEGNPDRLGQVTPGGGVSFATRLPARSDPTGLASPVSDELILCLSGSRKLMRYRITKQGFAAPELVLATDCALGVIILTDGRIAYATDRSIKVVAPP